MNYFENQLIISVIFQAKMSNICWFQLLKHEDLVLHEMKSFGGFWTAGWTKEAISGLWETAKSIFHNFFLTFSRLNDDLINHEKQS